MNSPQSTDQPAKDSCHERHLPGAHRAIGSSLLITIDRPKARNAVNAAVAKGLAAALESWRPTRHCAPVC